MFERRLQLSEDAIEELEVQNTPRKIAETPESREKEKMIEERSQLSEDAIVELRVQNSPRRNRKPRIHELYEVLESVGLLWRVFGTFPFTIKGSLTARRYEINKYHVIYSFFLFSVCFIGFLYDLLDFIRSYNDDEALMSEMLYLFRSFMSNMYVASSNVWQIIRHKRLLETINKMRDQHISLQRMNCLNHKPNIKIVRASAWVTFASIVLLTFWGAYGGAHNLNGVNLKFPIIIVIGQLIRLSNLSVFVTLVGGVGLGFRALNEKLKIIVMKANVSTTKTNLISDICAANIRLISRAHLSLCAMGKQLNSIFGFGMIIYMTLAVVVMSSTLYHIFYEIERNDTINYGKIFGYFRAEVIFSGSIIVIVSVCNWTSYQAMYAGQLIHQIHVEETNSELYADVKLFSLQLRHQKLEFNAGGFFPLNSTLLLMILGTLTGHLIILIQFHPKLD